VNELNENGQDQKDGIDSVNTNPNGQRAVFCGRALEATMPLGDNTRSTSEK
jgi:hypothetical protein